MTTLDIVLRAMAGTQLLFLACLLLARSRGDPALRYAALLPVGMAAFMLTSAPMPRGALGGFTVPLTFVCVANPAWFWLSTKAWFDDDFRPGLHDIVGVVAMSAIGVAHEIGAGGAPSPALDALFKGAILAFIGLAVLKVARDRAADLVETRRRGRIAFVTAVFLYALAGIALQVAYDGRLPPGLVRANVTLLLVVAFWLSVWLATGAVGRPRRALAIVPPPSPSPGPALDVATASPARGRPVVDDALVARVVHAMEGEHRYREESLTVAGLAEVLRSQEYRVRRAINQRLGYRNFNELLHRYRLDEASARLRSQPHLPILTIALDVGFGSIGPFNRAFRARFGCTPTQYRSGPAPASPLIDDPAPGVAAV